MRVPGQSACKPVFMRVAAWSCIFSILQKILAKKAKKIYKKMVIELQAFIYAGSRPIKKFNFFSKIA